MPFLHDHKKFKVWWKEQERKTFKSGFRQSIFTKFKDKYRGDWQNNVYEGKGELLTRSRKLYEGDWKQNFQHGYGTLAEEVSKNTFELTYAGEWEKGLPNGNGITFYKNSDIYIGQRNNGKRHGNGRMWGTDGTYYLGEWKQNLRHGFGIFIEANGNRYEGQWKRDLKHGFGRFYHLNKGVCQEGIWTDNMCRFSTIIVIPYRQTAPDRIPYTIPPLTLKSFEQLKYDRKYELLGLESLKFQEV